MDDVQDNYRGAAKAEKTARLLRTIWLILLVVFGFIILLDLYEWLRGGDNGGLRRILPPLGMLCVASANIFGRRNKNLRTVLIATALVLVVAGLITMFIY